MSARDVLKATVDTIPRSGTGEDEERFLEYFYPTPRFLQALDRSLVVVLGERGTGKTALFNVLAAGGFEALLSVGERRQPTPFLITRNAASWGGSSVAAAHLGGADDLSTRAWWAGHLVRALGTMDGLPGAPVGWPDSILRASDTEGWFPEAVRGLEAIGRGLSELDARLDAAGRDLFVVYDDLDQTATTYAGLYGPLRGLLGFWYDHFRRLRRIRPKIFLRTDLFRSESLAFPDASKLFSGYATELTWDRPSLYAMWIKRLANRPGAQRAAPSRRGGPRRRDPVVGWIQERAPLLSFFDAGQLGQLPMPYPARDGVFDRVIEGLVGKYMGANPRKGFTYPWLPNHVQDAKGRLAPRAFLGLLRGAAEEAIQTTGSLDRAEHPLRPAHLIAALAGASEQRIRELTEQEPWIGQLHSVLGGLEVPASRVDWLQRLSLLTERGMSELPSNTPDGLLDHLGVRGIVEQRSDGRLNVPDIYLFGFGMKRRGGVRRAG